MNRAGCRVGCLFFALAVAGLALAFVIGLAIGAVSASRAAESALDCGIRTA